MFKFDYKDWSAVHHKIWEELLMSSNLLEEKDKICVEVGCFEGRSTIWFSERLLNTPNSVYYCVDSWQGGEEIERLDLGYDMKRVYDNFCHNISLSEKREQISYYISDSESWLSRFSGSLYRNVDFIYLDGSHTQRDTLVDLVLSLTMLKKDGILIVDDYTNNMYTENDFLRPRKAVDFVKSSLKDEVTMYQTHEFQAVIKRIR